MSHEVIMPALGMAQDTGLLVAWHKAVGDKVAVGDILMEVETDKSTMEVEAAVAGFVTELRAMAGSDVPVGEVVAVISETADAVVRAPARSATQPKAENIVAVAPMVPAPEPTPIAEPVMHNAPPARVDGRVLASPKARRLAAEQGLDLSRLAAAGVPLPYRVADLERLKSMPAKSTASHEAASQVAARVAAAGFSGFCAWLDGEVAQVEPRNMVWSAFAAAALRAQTNARQVGVRVVQPALGVQDDYSNPDQEPVSRLQPTAATAPDLILHDLTGSRITSVRHSAEDCPILTIVRNGAAYELTLSYAEARFSTTAALALLDGFAARLEEPLRHLL